MTKVIEFIGILLMLMGGGAIDSTSMMIPMIMAFAGLGIFVGGCYLEDLKEGVD